MMPSLEILDLSGNILNGSIPLSIGCLILERIDSTETYPNTLDKASYHYRNCVYEITCLVEIFLNNYALLLTSTSWTLLLIIYQDPSHHAWENWML
ncbi:hypothetical protein CsSME_00036724 [Camellia sinensis var. sinensis]